MTKKNKDFDCVEMQDRAALRIHEALKGKTWEEESAYWKQCAEKARVSFPLLKREERVSHLQNP